MAGVFHISEEEAAKDVRALFDCIKAGDDAIAEFAGERVLVTRLDQADQSEVVQDEHRSAVSEKLIERPLMAAERSSSSSPGRTAKDIIRGLADWESAHGKLVVDEDFADDLEDIHRLYNKPLDGSRWD